MLSPSASTSMHETYHLDKAESGIVTSYVREAEMKSERSGPIRKGPLPPVYFLCSFVLELGLHFAIPVTRIIPPPWHYIGVVLIVWAIYTVLGGLTTPYIDNGAHIGGLSGGWLVGRRLHPLVLEPMPLERARVLRRWLWIVWIVLAYTAIGWLFR